MFNHKTLIVQQNHNSDTKYHQALLAVQLLFTTTRKTKIPQDHECYVLIRRISQYPEQN